MKKAFMVATVGWALALPGATLLASRQSVPAAMYVVGLAAYAAGSIVCHQLPARTFHLWSTPMPVCARCTGIYAGAAMAVAVLMLKRNRGRGSTPIGASRVRRYFVAGALPTLGTILFELSTGTTPSNVARALAGIPLGGIVAWVIASALAERREVN